MAYGERAQRERLQRKGHSWYGGPVAAGWLEFKYLIYPRWKSGDPAEKAMVSQFLAQKESRALGERLAFEVKAPGYEAPTTPAQMTAMPGIQR